MNFDFYLDVNNKTTNISRLGFRSSDDSGISSFQKAPFSVYGDPPASELNNVLQKIKKNAERADKSIVSILNIIIIYQITSMESIMVDNGFKF